MINQVDPEILDAFHRKYHIDFVDPEHNRSGYGWDTGAKMPQSKGLELVELFGLPVGSASAGFHVHEDHEGLPLVLEVAEQVIQSYRRTNIWGSFHSPAIGKPRMEARLQQLRYHIRKKHD